MRHALCIEDDCATRQARRRRRRDLTVVGGFRGVSAHARSIPALLTAGRVRGNVRHTRRTSEAHMAHGPEDDSDEMPARTPDQEAQDAGCETHEEYEDYLEDLNED
jgi:hypothetical protein